MPLTRHVQERPSVFAEPNGILLKKKPKAPQKVAFVREAAKVPVKEGGMLDLSVAAIRKDSKNRLGPRRKWSGRDGRAIGSRPYLIGEIGISEAALLLYAPPLFLFSPNTRNYPQNAAKRERKRSISPRCFPEI